MPSVKGKQLTAARRHFCRIYCINGHNAAQAYKEAYPNSKSGWDAHGARLIGNDSIQAEISRIEAKAVQESGRTVESLDLMYQKGFDIAETQKNPAAMATNATGIARLYGMDKDNDMGTKDKPADITPDQAQQYRDMARAANQDRIKLSKETA